jgi:Domain of unknown function (DUF4430)
MKRTYIIAAAILAVFFILFSKTLIVRPPSVSIQTKITTSPVVSVTLDTGSTIATISGVTAQNAFQALVEAAVKQNLKLTTKQYDFGVFVEQIGTIVNTKEKSWIYFVNGISGTVAADKHQLKTGDSVEWKYITPTME